MTGLLWKIMTRTIRQDYAYALINIVGLAIGLACFILIALYLESQFSYDRHFENHENIHRLAVERNQGGSISRFARTSGLVPQYLTRDYVEIQDSVRFRPASTNGVLVLRNEDTTAYWEDVFLADDNLFQVFNHNVIYGDPINGLVDPTTVAISRSLSEFYFGDQNPVGETLSTDTASYTVTIVYEDLPQNTHHRYNAILSYNRLDAFNFDNDITRGAWNIQDIVYLVMQDNYPVERFDDISTAFYAEYMAESGAEFNSTNRFYLEPLAGIHFDSTTQIDFPRGNRFYLYTFASIGVLILLIALINYINLATVRSIRRAKEIGMRKVLGAERRQLMVLFLSESITYVLAAVILSCVLLYGVLDYTNIEVLLNAELNFNLLERPWLIPLLLATAIVVGLLSGLYPSFYLSSIHPGAAFRDYKGAGRSAIVRQSLVFLQFVISVVVISCTLIMGIQLQYLQNRDLGFGKDQLLLVTVRGADMIERIPTLIADLSLDPRVESAAQSNNIFGQVIEPFPALIETESGERQQIDINAFNAGENWRRALGIELLQGRDLIAGEDDPHMALVNQEMVEAMGWSNPIGKIISYPDDLDHIDTVVGVIDDFHYKALHMESGPQVIFLTMTDFGDMSPLNRLIQTSGMIIRLSNPSDPTNLSFLQEKWREYDLNHPFEYQFVSDIMAEVYMPEQRQVGIIGLAAAICVFISCLGLYGLSAFNTTRRARELSIRKVLGASPLELIVMLFRNSIVLIGSASVVATVVSVLILNRWLSNFAYRTEIGNQWEVFLFASFCALAIAFCTVALQARRTVNSNPSDKLQMDI